MASEKVRSINIHRTQKYDNQFVQIDYDNIGVVLGKLTKVGAKNLYIYFMGNKDGYTANLIASNYANWLGKPYAKDGKVFNESNRSAVNKQIREGLDQLIEEGYLVEVTKDAVYNFYEYGTKSSESDKSSHVEQIVPDVTKSVTVELKVPDGTKSSESNENSHVEPKVPCETKSSGFIF